jgi:hypothetical protein
VAVQQQKVKYLFYTMHQLKVKDKKKNSNFILSFDIPYEPTHSMKKERL